MVPTKVEWDTRTESCFEDTKTYPGYHELGLIGCGGLHGGSRKMRLLSFGARKRGPTMRVEQIPQPTAAKPNQSRGGVSLARRVAGTMHKI